jgi:hypothetical protein
MGKTRWVKAVSSAICIQLMLLYVVLDAGIGAGIDSYYEYCLKSYILLGDNIYWDRFQKVTSVHGFNIVVQIIILLLPESEIQHLF